MADIDQTKDVVKFIVEVAKAVAESLEDEKFTLPDVKNFIKAIVALPSAISGLGEVPEEIRDLDEDELLELYDFVKAELDIDDDDSETIAGHALSICFEIFDLVLEIIEATKKE